MNGSNALKNFRFLAIGAAINSNKFFGNFWYKLRNKAWRLVGFGGGLLYRPCTEKFCESESVF